MELGTHRKNVPTGQCIICQKEVGWKLSDRRKEGGSRGEQTDKLDKLREIAQKTVANNPRFLRTFNEVWRVLNENNDSEVISLETVICSKGQGSKAKFSKKAPPLCQPCCEKVLAAGNLLKALKEQVREIKVLLEESRKKPQEDNFEDIQRDFDGKGGTADLNADDEIKDEEDEWPWQESASEDPRHKVNKDEPNSLQYDVELSNSSIRYDPESPKETEMECDEDLPNRLDDQDTANADNAIEDDGDDDSNWAWDDDDPDYIKSEQEDSNDDDEELTSEEELDEEPLTLVENQSGPSIPSDPLEIPSSTTTNPQKIIKTAKQSSKFIPCDVEGCSLKFPTISNLFAHKRKHHSSSPPQKVGNAKKAKTTPPASAASSSGKIITCALELCTESFPNMELLDKHKMLHHTNLMIQLGKINPEHKFICSCGRRFPTQRKLYVHQSKNKTAHPDFEFKLRETRSQLAGGQPCDICGDPIKLPNILEHLAGHVGVEYVVKCPNFKECGHAFTHSKSLIGRHVRLRRFVNCKKICDENKFGLKCETCGYTTDQRYRLSTHVTNEHERGILPRNLNCPISGCGKMFAVKQSIFLHLHAHSVQPITTQICRICGGDIKVEEMERHLKDKHGISEVFNCRHCSLKFLVREELLEHLWKHRDSGLSCDICGEDKPVKYMRYSEFRDHCFMEHKLCPKKHKCGECDDKWFWRVKDLTNHNLRYHTGEIPTLAAVSMKQKKKEKAFICDGCNVSFANDVLLISHKIRVHGADPFTCDICSMTFHNKSKFSRHQKEHAGVEFQKEWKCEVEGCGRTFKEKRLWKRHRESGHGGVKPHVCEECGKGFGFPQGLKIHRDMVHLGLRPWSVKSVGKALEADDIKKT